MALSESALKKLHKDEIINLALDYQSKLDSTLAGIRNELSDLILLITKLVNAKLKEKFVSLELQSQSNSQYSRREFLELRGIPETFENKYLQGTVLGIFEKLDVMSYSVIFIFLCRFIYDKAFLTFIFNFMFFDAVGNITHSNLF